MTNATACGHGRRALSLLSLETPVPIVDLDRLESNLERMASYTASHGLALRPHVKTHKTPWIGARQVALGAVGLTCATPHEAEEMSAVAGDILVAYPPVGGGRLRRLMSLPTGLSVSRSRSTRRKRCRGSPMRRARRAGAWASTWNSTSACAGSASPRRATPSTWSAWSQRESSLEFRGIAFYPGHIRSGVDAQDEAIARLRRDVAAVREAFDRAGIARAGDQRRIDADSMARARDRGHGSAARHVRLQ